MFGWTLVTLMAYADDLTDRNLSWGPVNDTVMGGVSSSQAQVTEGVLTFTGTVSLDNKGGFASVRSGPTDLALAGLTGFRLTLKGDGKAYDFTVRRRDLPIRGGSYRVQLTTTGEAQTLEFPLTAFSATAFGRPVPSAPPLVGAGAQIESVGFLIASKQEGAFAIDVQAIEPLFDDGSPRDPSARGTVQRVLLTAIATGAPAFNQGNPAHCADVYQTALRNLLELAPQALTVNERAAVQQALLAGLAQSAEERAWTYRRAIDGLLESL